MKKLLSLVVFATIGLTGCGADSETAISTFDTNLANAETIEINYKSGEYDFTFTADEEGYDEALAAVTEEISDLPSDMETYENKVSTVDNNVVVEFETEGFTDEAGGLDTYTFAEDGMSASYDSEFTNASGETSSAIITVTLS